MVTVRFKKLYKDSKPYVYTQINDACMDMYSIEETIIPAHSVRVVNTGLAIELPIGFEGIVRGRSGLASKGIYTHIGTIDEEYRGEVGVILFNTTKEDFVVEKGMRIAQFTVKPVYHVNLLEEDNLTETKRGSNGFGSSGC